MKIEKKEVCFYSQKTNQTRNRQYSLQRLGTTNPSKVNCYNGCEICYIHDNVLKNIG
jgi:hypothetical protein